MEDYNQLKEEVDASFKTLQNLITDSFTFMKNDPGKKDEMIQLWKNHILQFTTYTYKTGERYENKDVFKSITKALMFGK